MIKEVFKYMKRRGDYRKHLSKREFGETWVSVTTIIEANNVQRKRLEVSTETILKHWLEDRVRGWLNAIKPSRNLLEMVRKAAKNRDFNSMSH